MKIRTEFWAKPIPLRCFDWSAVDDNYEPGQPIGHGATEQEAIANLLEDTFINLNAEALDMELIQTAYQALLEKGFTDTSITVIAFETKFFAGIGTRYAMRAVFDHRIKQDTLYTGVEPTPEAAAAKLLLLISNTDPVMNEALGNAILGIKEAV